MSGPRPVDPDEPLLAELRQLAARADPMPHNLVDNARAALTWLRVDAELAELLSDSALDLAQPAFARGVGSPRLLTFEASGLTIEVEVQEEADGHLLVGQLAPPREAVVDVQTERGSESVRADELGRFRVAGIPAGRIRLRVAAPGDPSSAVETSWITI